MCGLGRLALSELGGGVNMRRSSLLRGSGVASERVGKRAGELQSTCGWGPKNCVLTKLGPRKITSGKII